MKNQFNLKVEKADYSQKKSIKKIPKAKNKLSILSSFGLACLTFFAFATVQAQDTNNSSQSTAQESFVIKGKVLDEFDPIPGVNIVLEGTDIGTVTDFEGNFEFPKKLSKGDVIIFSYVGLESEKVVIENEDSASNIPLSINLKLDPIIIMGEVAVKEVYKSKRNN
ncbi:MAG: carboxypeptidase-like regulatory domain-containing protein [Lacinutrix sp.]|uniref:carboxypeptidase-like regulatory domain-containing protein n=1 Tax=Lacinutrix sp. TaxID=1937692 RepID=UPI0030A20B88